MKYIVIIALLFPVVVMAQDTLKVGRIVPTDTSYGVFIQPDVWSVIDGQPIWLRYDEGQRRLKELEARTKKMEAQLNKLMELLTEKPKSR